MFIEKKSELDSKLRAKFALMETVELSYKELYDIIDTLDKAQEDKAYREWVKEHKFKGTVAGFHVMDVESRIEHNVRERCEADERMLKKLAHNPMLNPEFKELLQRAILRSRDMLLWRKEYIEMRNKYEALKNKPTINCNALKRGTRS